MCPSIISGITSLLNNATCDERERESEREREREREPEWRTLLIWPIKPIRGLEGHK